MAIERLNRRLKLQWRALIAWNPCTCSKHTNGSSGNLCCPIRVLEPCRSVNKIAGARQHHIYHLLALPLRTRVPQYRYEWTRTHQALSPSTLCLSKVEILYGIYSSSSQQSDVYLRVSDSSFRLGTYTSDSQSIQAEAFAFLASGAN